MKYCESKHNSIRVFILWLLSLVCAYTFQVRAQESCYEQYLREHNMTILTAEDADDSYEEQKMAVLAKQMYDASYLLMQDTVAERVVIAKADGTHIADVHMALVDSTWYMWLSVDPLADKYPNVTPYIYCNGNPVMLVDPDGRDWYDADGEIKWTDCKSQAAMNKAKIVGTYLGNAVLDFQGSRYETLGWGTARPNKAAGKNGFGYMNGIGAITADVTLYGPGGKDDITSMTGFTMTSDYSTFGAIAEGWYTANYKNPGKTGILNSHWLLTGLEMKPGYCPEMDNKPNLSPDAHENYGKPWKTGVYIHSCNSNGYAGPTCYGGMRPKSGISTGCLILMPNDFKNLNAKMAKSGVNSFIVRVNR